MLIKGRKERFPSGGSLVGVVLRSGGYSLVPDRLEKLRRDCAYVDKCDQCNAGNNNSGSEENSEIEHLIGQQPSKYDGDDRIDVRVRCHAGRCADLQQPDIRAERNNGSE